MTLHFIYIISQVSSVVMVWLSGMTLTFGSRGHGFKSHSIFLILFSAYLLQLTLIQTNATLILLHELAALM